MTQAKLGKPFLLAVHSESEGHKARVSLRKVLFYSENSCFRERLLQFTRGVLQVEANTLSQAVTFTTLCRYLHNNTEK